VRRAALFFLALAVLASGCGDDEGSAGNVLQRSVNKLEDVKSGTLRLEVAAAPTSAAEREVGFRVEGPFALAQQEGALPTVRFTYTDLLGDRSQSAVFASTAEQATVTVAGRTFTPSDDDVAHLRGRADAADDLLRLHVDEWARSPRFGSAPRLDGAAGRRIVAEVDVAAALHDIVAVAADVGTQPRRVGELEDEDAERLRRHVRSSRLEVVVDEHDVVRRVRTTIEFGPEAGDDLARVLGRLAGLRLSVEVELDDVKLS
jgi:hypothetical protein